jgi:hypothetical protein
MLRSPPAEDGPDPGRDPESTAPPRLPGQPYVRHRDRRSAPPLRHRGRARAFRGWPERVEEPGIGETTMVKPRTQPERAVVPRLQQVPGEIVDDEVDGGLRRASRPHDCIGAGRTAGFLQMSQDLERRSMPLVRARRSALAGSALRRCRGLVAMAHPGQPLPPLIAAPLYKPFRNNGIGRPSSSP